jgi:CTP-dependent riboflavin kinase
MLLEGTVVTGFGWHRHNMGPWRSLPFSAYPGTLNVKVGYDQVAKFLDEVTDWVEHDGRSHPYRLGTLHGCTVAVTDSLTRRDEVEVIAPRRLRDIPLNDGDTVTIVLSDAVE